MNKLKGSSSAVGMKHLIIIFVTSLLLALPIRTYQLLVLVNPQNGFYEDADFTVPVLFGIVAIFTLLFLVLSFVSKSIPAPKITEGKNPLLGLASLVMAGGFVWDVIVIERKIVPQITGNISADIFRNLFSVYLKESGGTFLILELIFAILAVFYFLIFAVSHFEGKPHYKRFAILALSPLCWSMSVLISKLMKPISFITVSELLFEIFMFVFAMLFFLTSARICSGVFIENSMWGIFGYGFAAALFGGIVAIPRLVVAVMGLAPVDGNEFSFSHLAMFIFTVVFVLASMGVGFKNGLENIKSVSDLELPDDEDVVVKGSDAVYVTEIADDEIKGGSDGSEPVKKNEIVIEDVFAYEIDVALDNYFDEINAESVFEKAEFPSKKSVAEAEKDPFYEIFEETEDESEEIIEEEQLVEEVFNETEEDFSFDEFFAENEDDSAEISEDEESVEEVFEETEELPLDEFFVETEENSSENAGEEELAERINQSTEVVTDDAEVSEEFVDFSEIFIEDVDDFEEDSEQEKVVKEKPKKTEVKEKSKKEKKSKRLPKEKKKKDSKQKKIFGKNKNQTEETEEPLRIVSLAELKKDKDSE